MTFAIARLTPIPATVPSASVIAPLVGAAPTGIVFGRPLAIQAPRLDPVAALRYE